LTADRQPTKGRYVSGFPLADREDWALAVKTAGGGAAIVGASSTGGCNMNEPLSWIWVAQVVVIIAAVAAGLLAIMWVTLRGRPTWHHVITHEVNKSWEEVKVAIEARERVKGLKPQWVYHGTHDQRQNGSRADSGPSPWS
jgi:hypothetical protein